MAYRTSSASCSTIATCSVHEEQEQAEAKGLGSVLDAAVLDVAVVALATGMRLGFCPSLGAGKLSRRPFHDLVLLLSFGRGLVQEGSEDVLRSVLL